MRVAAASAALRVRCRTRHLLLFLGERGVDV
jgi:hypothetical protein